MEQKSNILVHSAIHNLQSSNCNCRQRTSINMKETSVIAPILNLKFFGRDFTITIFQYLWCQNKRNLFYDNSLIFRQRKVGEVWENVDNGLYYKNLPWSFRCICVNFERFVLGWDVFDWLTLYHFSMGKMKQAAWQSFLVPRDVSHTRHASAKTATHQNNSRRDSVLHRQCINPIHLSCACSMNINFWKLVRQYSGCRFK